MAAPRPLHPGWTAHGTAAGAAAVTGAAQLGLGYGLGVVTWPAGPTPDDSLWLGSLGWATWIAASATVFGAVLAGRLRYRFAGPWRLTLAASAAVGALLPLALIALPARTAVRSDTFAPATIAAAYAAVGIVAGAAVAYWAVVSRPVAANLIATAVWLWLLAATAVVVELTTHRPSTTHLTSWQFADPGGVARFGTIHWPSAVLTLAAALILGILTSWPAVRRGDLDLGAAASGAAGPALLAVAFLVLAPRLTGTAGTLESAFLIAPYAVLAGLAGSAMSVAIGRRIAAATAGRHDWSTLAHAADGPPVGVAAASAERPARPGAGDAIERDGRVPARSRPTVAPPPASPPIAVINPPRVTEVDATAEPAAGNAELAAEPPAVNAEPPAVNAEPAAVNAEPPPVNAEPAAVRADPTAEPTAEPAAGETESTAEPPTEPAAEPASRPANRNRVPATRARAAKSGNVGKS